METMASTYEKHMKLAKENSLLVYYDVELCDGSFTSEIYQIGAKTSTAEFSAYILPTGNIDWGVTKRVGGIKIQESTHGQRQLMKSSVSLQSVDAYNGFKFFIDWVKQCKNCGSYKNVFLIAHGSADMPALINNVSRSELTKEFKEVVTYFVDSLNYFQSKFPEFEKHSISFLYEKIFNKVKTDVHDALEDAKALHDLMNESSKDSQEELMKNISKNSVGIEEAYLESARKVMKSIQKRKNKDHMSTNLINFCAFPSEVLEKMKQEKSEQSKKDPIITLVELCYKHKWKTPKFSSKRFENYTSKNKLHVGRVVVNGKSYLSKTPSNNINKTKSDVAELALKKILEPEERSK